MPPCACLSPWTENLKKRASRSAHQKKELDISEEGEMKLCFLSLLTYFEFCLAKCFGTKTEKRACDSRFFIQVCTFSQSIRPPSKHSILDVETKVLKWRRILVIRKSALGNGPGRCWPQ